MAGKSTGGKRKKIFVTGGTGRLGTMLLERLVSKGYEVRTLVVNAEKIRNLPGGTIPFIGNLTDIHTLEDACEGVDTVFHLASIITHDHEKSSDIMRVNVEGTRKLLDVCKRAGVKKIIYTSTVDVYGKIRRGILTEESEPRPSDVYGYSKMLAEKEIASSGIDYTIFRIAAIYGPSFATSFFKLFRIVKEGKAVIIGGGKNHLSLIHIDDVVDALASSIGNPACRNRVYNLSDGEIYTQEFLLNLAAEMLHVKKVDRHVSSIIVNMLARKRNLDSDELRFLTSDRVLDISRVREDLDFSPKVDIRVGGGELVDMFLRHEPRLKAVPANM